jgi:hypothetical protein
LTQSAADAGVPHAVAWLATNRGLHHGFDRDPTVLGLLRQAVQSGDLQAHQLLAGLLEERGDQQGAEAVSRQALDRGSWQPTVSVAEWRDLDSPVDAERLIRSLPAHVREAAFTEFVRSREGGDDPDGAERLALSLAVDGYMEPLLALVDSLTEMGKKNDARRLLAAVSLPDTAVNWLRLASIHARAGDHSQARMLLDRSIDRTLGESCRVSTSAQSELDAEVALLTEFCRSLPVLADSLFAVLDALDERYLAERLGSALASSTPPPKIAKVETSDDSSLDDDTEELAHAYAVIADYRARHGDFHEAEIMARRAAVAGDSYGLHALSRELLRHQDVVAAQRIALWALNVAPIDSGWFPPGETVQLLVETRGDETILVSGLNADGTTAPPWPDESER